jgi:hypothetical protein
MRSAERDWQSLLKRVQSKIQENLFLQPETVTLVVAIDEVEQCAGLVQPKYLRASSVAVCVTHCPTWESISPRQRRDPVFTQPRPKAFLGASR